MITSMEDAEARWPDLRELRLKREAFEARWPIVFRLDAPGGILEVAEFETYWAFREHGISAIDGLEEWLVDQCGARGEGWDHYDNLMGIADQDHAFAFRMRWT